jgi:hypothetical protein
LIEGGRDHRRKSEHNDSEERPAGSAKEDIAMADSTQDFTTR